MVERFNLGSSQPKPRAGRRKHIADDPQGAASRGASKAKVDPPKVGALLRGQRGRALILNISSIQGRRTKLGRSANDPIGIVAPTLAVKDLSVRA